jgi:predicted membrane-bound mannosyltransferase
VYLQNRNLLLDEANVARNLFERDFTGLVKPLNYEQYAPPVFLWVEKLNAILFGFSEYALRLYPLLAGIASVFVMYALLKRLVPMSALWFPLLLFVATHMLIRYSSELRQSGLQ